MKKVVPCTFIISLLFWLAYAEETTTTKETNMQTIATTADQQATLALQKLEEETKATAFDFSLLKAADPSEDEEEWDDDEDEDDEDEWDNEEDEDWDEEDDEFED